MTDKATMITYYYIKFTNFNDFIIGQKVKLWYDCNNPQTAKLEGKDNWILAMAFGVFGFVICIVFYPVLIKQLIDLLLNLP